MEVEAALPDRHHVEVVRASATSASHCSARWMASWGCRPTVAPHLRMAPRDLDRPAGGGEVGAHADQASRPRPHGRRRSWLGVVDRGGRCLGQVAVAVDPAAGCHPAGAVADSAEGAGRCGGRAVRPSPAARPTVRPPQAAASGRRCSSGVPASPSRRQSSPAARGITGEASNATIRSTSRQSPSTAATAAVSPALWSFHGCCSSMYELVSRMRCHTAPNPPE